MVNTQGQCLATITCIPSCLLWLLSGGFLGGLSLKTICGTVSFKALLNLLMGGLTGGLESLTSVVTGESRTAATVQSLDFCSSSDLILHSQQSIISEALLES